MNLNANPIKIVLLLVLAISSFNVVGQNKNELSLNLPYTVAAYPEISYERLISDDFTAGVSAGYNIDGGEPATYSIFPYSRFFFSRKPAYGFFIEVNSALYNIVEERTTYRIGSGTTTSSEQDQAAGLGLAVGGKFVNRSNWVGQLYLGIGRNFLAKEGIDELYPRAGVLLGRRF